MDLRDSMFSPRGETRESIENPTVPVSAANFLSFFGVNGGSLAAVTLDNALTVPAVLAACTFLPATLAALPLHGWRKTGGEMQRISGGLDNLLGDAPNDEWTSFAWRQYFWQQVFTLGRGLSWIERSGTNIVGIWPMDATKTTVKRVNLKKVYQFDGGREYPAADIIDIQFMPRADQLSVYGPIAQGAKTIQRALAMMDYGASFFAGGGVPPLAVEGPLPAGPEAMKRASADIMRAIKAAKQDEKPIIQLPSGYKLTPVGFDPDKGQMVEAMQAIVEEVARIWGLPPVFLQDLSHGTYSNTEQQDLNFVKHVIARWATALEQELNLKLFGRKNNSRLAEHNLDGLMRGDLVARMSALASGVQNGLITPNEGRALDNRQPLDGGDRLYIQGATVPLTNAGNPNDGKTQPNATA